MSHGTGDGLTSFTFLGDPHHAAARVPSARVLLIGHLTNMRDRHLTLARHQWHLADGAVVEIRSNGGVHRVIIDVRAVSPARPPLAPSPIYEFAAQNPFPAANTQRWFQVFFEPGSDPPCRTVVRADYTMQGLPTDKSASPDGVVCSPVGQIIHCGASKGDHITWHGPIRTADNAIPQFVTRGAGDMVHVDYHANRYCNYQVETGIDQVYWYGTTGRGGLAAPHYSATAPIAEGLRVIDGVRVILTVAPCGLVVVTRQDSQKSASAEPTLPDWTAANELGQGFPFGVWKLNSGCTKAISVLHGNPWALAAYAPTFDVTRLLSDLDPAIGGAFQSAVFELTLDLSLQPDGHVAVAVEANQIGEIAFVQTAGIAYGYPEKNSNGSYWYAADYGVEDERLTARVLYARRDTFDVAYTAHPPDPATPYANIAGVTVGPSLDETDVDPCGAGSVWGITKKYSSVGWWANDYDFVRTKTVTVDIRLQCTGMEDLVLESSSVVDELQCTWGATGSSYVWLWSNGSSGSYDVAGYVAAVANNTYTACTQWHVRSSGFTGPTAMGADGWYYRYQRKTTRAPTVKSQLLGVDLRAKTLFYTETRTEWGGDGAGLGTLRAGVGWQQWNGCYQDVGHTVTESAGVLSAIPGLMAQKTLRTESIPAPAPNCEQWAEFYSANQSDADAFPLITKLWHHMVLGKRNPKTPGVDGGFIGPFVDWHRYYPYQMIALSADSINWHPSGWIGLRFVPAEVDRIQWTDAQGALWQTRHADLLATAVVAESKKEQPELTDEDVQHLQSAALTTRGEWVATGPITAFGRST